MPQPQTVWILGAGLSASLGGPLLKDLFSEALNAKVRATYPSKGYGKLYGHAPTVVERLYSMFRPGTKDREIIWTDAEDFLDALDSAQAADAAGGSRKHIEALVQKVASNEQVRDLGPEDKRCEVLSNTARRLLAAQCSAFLDMLVGNERWAPYERWASNLDGSDTIITFNYDLVVERAMVRAGCRGNLAVVLPRPTGVGGATSLPDERRVWLLKLHGSVNWKLNEEDHRCESASDDFALQKAEDKEVVIASPGPTKSRVSAELEYLRQLAKLRITHATTINFLGYRFPPSDSHARRWLLDAISENDPGAAHGNRLTINTVLGPRTTDDDTQRLLRMLEWAAARRTPAVQSPASGGVKFHAVNALPLYAQDFLDLYQPTMP